MKTLIKISIVILVLFIVSGCSTHRRYRKGCVYDICDILSKPEKINIIETPIYTHGKKSPTKEQMLSGFPFVSYRPIIDFGGRFPPEFYSAIKCRWSAVSFQDADYWSLRFNPYLYDVIYVKPLWIGNFSFKSKDFLKDLSYTYNVSFRELKILKDWIKRGGVLWIESAIYISSYDVSLNRLTQRKLHLLFKKLRSIKVFGRKVNLFVLRAKMIDKFHTKPLNKSIVVLKSFSEQPNLLKGIHRLKLSQYDYLGVYFAVEGKPIIKYKGRVYASYINCGRGKVITTVPFDFLDVHYDGELYRWNLLRWIMRNRCRAFSK